MADSDQETKDHDETITDDSDPAGTAGADQAEAARSDEDADGPPTGGDEEDEAKAKMKELEESPPENLEDWPQSGKAMYETFGGPEGQDHSYHEGPEEKLGPSSLRHQEGGDVEIEGEKVDNPDEYKGDPVPGGPTDPNSPDMAGEREKEKEGGDE